MAAVAVAVAVGAPKSHLNDLGTISYFNLELIKCPYPDLGHQDFTKSRKLQFLFVYFNRNKTDQPLLEEFFRSTAWCKGPCAW